MKPDDQHASFYFQVACIACALTLLTVGYNFIRMGAWEAIVWKWTHASNEKIQAKPKVTQNNEQESSTSTSSLRRETELPVTKSISGTSLVAEEQEKEKPNKRCKCFNNKCGQCLFGVYKKHLLKFKLVLAFVATFVVSIYDSLSGKNYRCHHVREH